MSPTKFAALTLAASALAASGCGGSSKTASTAATTAVTSSAAATTAVTTHPTGPALTRAQLIAKGDAICARENAKTSVLQAETIKSMARIFPQIAIYRRSEAGELNTLVPPSSLAGDWSRIVKDLELQSHYLDEVAHDIDIHDEHAAYHPFGLVSSTIDDMLATGKRDGFARCSKLS